MRTQSTPHFILGNSREKRRSSDRTVFLWGSLCAGCPLLVSEPPRAPCPCPQCPLLPMAPGSPCRNPCWEAEEEQHHTRAKCMKINHVEISQAADISEEKMAQHDL